MIAAATHFVFGLPWWLAIIITVMAMMINGWIAG